MVTRQQTIMAHRNNHSGRQASGQSPRDVHHQQDSSFYNVHDQDMSQPSHQDLHVNDMGQRTGLQRKSPVPSRADTIAAYQNQQSRQLLSGTDGPNMESHAQQDDTSSLPSEDANNMPSQIKWPSHARICRTRPEDEGKKFGRGVLKGLKAARKHFDNGTEKLPIEFSTRLGGTIGVNYRLFVDEVVIFMKKHAPLIGARKWSDIDDAIKREIVKDALELWDLEDTPDTAKKILNIANERYRGWRSTLHATYKCYRTDAERRRNRPDDVGVEEWDHLIDYFGNDEQFQKLSRVNSENRKKQKTKHLMGSKSYPQLSYEKNDACAQVTENETEQGGPISSEQRNTIFQNSYRSALGCGTSQAHGCGYMAKRPHSVSESLRTQMDEHARVTTETQRQNEEINYHVRNLEDKNEELNLQVQDLEEKNNDLKIQVENLGNKNDELNLHVKNLEDQLSRDREQRAKEMEELKKSMRDEFLKMFGNQQRVIQQPGQQKYSERSSNGKHMKSTVLPENISGARIISSQHLRKTANLLRRS